ncbi:hypothetical protein N783_08450 [Pontibacillus marinus BH030004 = DSM 16465]|uniref:DUF4304 domain-containing protein n=2 Tax=Pontibacillus TaxID=289201 RepID=A0A0A5FVR5_9BACI|nr:MULTISPECIES: hypothetical protein [Pontibacillus]KGX83103.1 hypothetical protein N783_08450 [Pontibacillus marinus BH030004 = DSM 16465]QHE50874.1 hypothetical protein GS400_01930 [Pontibacillus sp. HMF3514]
MVNKQIVKEKTIAMMEKELDALLKAKGFSRRKNSTKYLRNFKESSQGVELTTIINPKYQSHAEAHLYPWIKIEVPNVNKIALNMVGDEKLLANKPDITLRQPLETLIPKSYQKRLFFYEDEGYLQIGEKLKFYMINWVFNFLDEVSTAKGIVKSYENKDARPLKSDQWIIYVTASYISLDEYDKAKKVLEDNFSSIGKQKRYREAFNYLDKLKKNNY